MKYLKSTLACVTLAAAAAWAVSPTLPQMAAFQTLAQGGTQWPVYKVEAGSIQADGQVAEPAWENAHPVYMSSEWMWAARSNLSPAGTKDALARFRLLYDQEALYMACEFLDDVHVESDGVEPWWNNDGLDITLFQPAGTVIVGDTVIQSVSFLRFWRRFTAHSGLFGSLNNTWVPRDPRQFGWASPEPEGSTRLGGVFCRAGQRCSELHPGAWSMEIRVPLTSLFQNGAGGMGYEGKAFKMNVAFMDDDVTTKNDVSGVYSTSHRYPLWWTGDTSQSLYRFCPVFMMAGFRDGSGGGVRFILPDEVNLYCDANPQDYLEKFAPCGISAEDLRLAGRPAVLTAFPNPFPVASEIRFSVPGQQAALRVFDARGSLVRDFGLVHAGRVTWDGRNSAGRPVAPGAYVLRMDAALESGNLKLTVIK